MASSWRWLVSRAALVRAASLICLRDLSRAVCAVERASCCCFSVARGPSRRKNQTTIQPIAKVRISRTRRWRVAAALRLLIAENPFRISALDGEQRVNLARVERIGLLWGSILERDGLDLAQVLLEVILAGDEIHELVGGLDVTEILRLDHDRVA